LPYYVHCLESADTLPLRYVRASDEPFASPEEANALAASLDPKTRPMVTGSPTPPDLEEKGQSEETS
jgi:hypothetical protein